MFELREITQIFQRQRSRLYFFKGYTTCATNYFFSLLAYFLGKNKLTDLSLHLPLILISLSLMVSILIRNM